MVGRECNGLVQHHLMLRPLRSANTLDEGRSNQYSFRQAFYERLGVAGRQQLHQRIDEQIYLTLRSG